MGRFAIVSNYLLCTANAHSMTTIGLIADTHGYLDPAVFHHFERCDEIWHAGDFGNLALAEELAAFKPLRGVYGNIDGHDVRLQYPETLHFTIEGLPVFMIHIGGYPGKYAPRVGKMLKDAKAGLFISGHSHILKIVPDPALNCLHINPGAAGKEGWHKVRTLVRFTISNAKLTQCEVIELGTRS